MQGLNASECYQTAFNVTRPAQLLSSDMVKRVLEGVPLNRAKVTLLLPGYCTYSRGRELHHPRRLKNVL